MTQTWNEAQAWELEWHNKQQFNTYNEEQKQYIYAHYLGLDKYATNHYGQSGWDFGNQSVLDVGCGETSILLKSNAKKRVGIDPLPYAEWVKMRYKEAGIEFLNIKAEDIKFKEIFDVGLLYNCLQHVSKPEKIVANMLKYCRVIHVFEWVDNGISEGHIHNLTEEKLNKWLKGEGKVEYINQNPCVGKAYFGIFKGLSYGK